MQQDPAAVPRVFRGGLPRVVDVGCARTEARAMFQQLLGAAIVHRESAGKFQRHSENSLVRQ